MDIFAYKYKNTYIAFLVTRVFHCTKLEQFNQFSGRPIFSPQRIGINSCVYICCSHYFVRSPSLNYQKVTGEWASVPLKIQPPNTWRSRVFPQAPSCLEPVPQCPSCNRRTRTQDSLPQGRDHLRKWDYIYASPHFTYFGFCRVLDHP